MSGANLEDLGLGVKRKWKVEQLSALVESVLLSVVNQFGLQTRVVNGDSFISNGWRVFNSSGDSGTGSVEELFSQYLSSDRGSIGNAGENEVEESTVAVEGGFSNGGLAVVVEEALLLVDFGEEVLELLGEISDVCRRPDWGVVGSEGLGSEEGELFETVSVVDVCSRGHDGLSFGWDSELVTWGDDVFLES